MTTRVGPRFRAWTSDPHAKLAITGASGWLGVTLTQAAVGAGLTVESGRLRLFGSSARVVLFPDGPMPIEGLSNAAPLGTGNWLLAHLAFLGKERSEDLSAESFCALNDVIFDETCRLAGSAEAVQFVFASSGAAAREEAGHGGLYGAMKREHEARLRDWCTVRDVRGAISRIFNVGGPYANKTTRYALSSMIADVTAGRDVVIRADRPIFRSFVHVQELVAVLLEAALRPETDMVPFDTVGRETVEIEDLARAVGQALGAVAAIRRQNLSGAPSDWYVGAGPRYMTELVEMGRSPVTLDQIIVDTAAWLRSASNG